MDTNLHEYQGTQKANFLAYVAHYNRVVPIVKSYDSVLHKELLESRSVLWVCPIALRQSLGIVTEAGRYHGFTLPVLQPEDSRPFVSIRG